ncbi:hypothetical protein CAAN3_01S00870 [[Candida] anglica]
MSSGKDFILDIVPKEASPDSSVVKFIVKDRESAFCKYIRTPLLGILGSILCAYFAYVTSKVYTPNQSILTLEGLKYLSTQYETRDLIMGVVLSIIILMIYLRQERQDSMVVMKDIGIQLNSQGRWRLIGKNTDKNCFIPQTEIIDLVIHEGFHGFGQVIFYMCILTKSQNSNNDTSKVKEQIKINNKNCNQNESIIKIAFPGFLPRKDILVEVWKQSRNVLFGASRRYWRRVPGQGLKECN